MATERKQLCRCQGPSMEDEEELQKEKGLWRGRSPRTLGVRETGEASMSAPPWSVTERFLVRAGKGGDSQKKSVRKKQQQLCPSGKQNPVSREVHPC